MKLETLLNTVLKINKDFSESTEKDPIYYETLHALLLEVFRDFTETQYSKIPLITRKTIEKLEVEILNKTSENYKNEYKEHIKVNGKFKPDGNNQKDSNIVKQVKNKIGFI